MNGFLSVLKPPGISSGTVVGKVKRCLPRGTRVGHAGTLDPAAAGVLPVMIGRATRLFEYTTDKKKTYIAELVPGIETDTQDITGTVTDRGRSGFSRDEIERVLPRFIGTVDQIPPMYSALKRDGKRLYDLARKGETCALEPRPVQIDQIRVLYSEGDHYFLEVTCGRGTYMRTLCHDIGKALGSCACMGMLIRTAAGPFEIGNAIPVEHLDAAVISEALLPMDLPVLGFQALDVTDLVTEKHLRAGMPIPCGEISPEGEPVRIYWQGQFCGMASRRENKLTFNCMLLE
ncbi:MAG: tRNA pseudouridine(55) synthase TruB [Clostridia bacterium]|nr:tRNA pseudouridine(55) synthase TruB [Clostridia bacterium]